MCLTPLSVQSTQNTLSSWAARSYRGALQLKTARQQRGVKCIHWIPLTKKIIALNHSLHKPSGVPQFDQVVQGAGDQLVLM